ncbi:MAG: nuclear transport factor 2 family protein [Acidobacteria bacterium]|nr:nuclear transport factor 2 family protein [Acidobacteriota bacterium]
MRRTSIIAVVAFVGGLGIGFVGRAALPPPDTRAADLAAIEELHREDIAATLSQDPNALANLWTEDAVRLPPGQPAEVGKQAIVAQNAKLRAAFPDFKVLTYVPDIQEVQVFDGSAFEWGYFEATYKVSAGGPTQELRAPVMRLLKRQGDGRWKFACVGILAGQQ